MKTRPDPKSASPDRDAADSSANSEDNLRLRQAALEVRERDLSVREQELLAVQREIDAGLEYYADLFDFVPAGYFTLSPHGEIRQVNQAGADFLGVERRLLLGSHFDRLVELGDQAGFGECLARVFNLGQSQTHEVRLSLPARPRLTVRLHTTLSADGKECRISMIDLTDRKATEQKLREREAFVRAVLDSLSEHVAVIDHAGVIVDVNRAWREFGLANGLAGAAAHAIGSNYFDVCQRAAGLASGEEAAEAEAGLRDVLSGKLPVFHLEYPCHSPGEQRWFRMSVTPLLGTRLNAVIRHANITQRKLTGIGLSRLAAIVEFCEDAIIGKDLHGVITSWNRGAEKAFGYSAEEMIGASITRLMPVPRLGEESFILGKIRNGESVEHFETQRLTKAGQLIDVSVTVSPIRDGAGTIMGASTIVRDITERKRTENRLRESEQLHVSLVDQLPGGIFRKDREGRYTFVNKRFCQTLGRGEAEILGHADADLFSVEVADRFRNCDLQAMTGRETISHDVEIAQASGGKVIIEVLMAAMRDERDTVTGAHGVIRDVTKERRIEEQFLQAQKMESIGQLAGGVAHDFNNLLAVMLMQADAIISTPDLPEPVLEAGREIEQMVTRAASLTRQLLLYSRQQVLLRRSLNLNDVVLGMAKMLERIIGEDVRLTLNLSKTPLMTNADAGMLEQLLMNLAVNARDAMPRGGRLLIETQEAWVDEGQVETNPGASPGRSVEVSVSDTGCGIPPEIITRIFEPFFTTKPVGKGTGLGLSTVQGIVRQHGGWLKIYSEPGNGTTFRVYLPAGDAFVPASAVPAPLPLAGSRTATLLLVEDDSSVRRATKQALARNGYRVMEASNGVEALALWREHAAEIDLLLTDLVMPGGVTGRELATQLHTAKPGLKVILASGYSPEMAGRTFSSDSNNAYLQKPYSIRDLLQSIAGLLGP